MACMCGDYCCGSCGPAQGNWRCPICGEWVSEGCDHIEAYCETCGAVDVLAHDTGGEMCAAHGHTESIRLKPEFEAQAAEIARAEAEAQAAEAQAAEEAQERYWSEYRED